MDFMSDLSPAHTTSMYQAITSSLQIFLNYNFYLDSIHNKINLFVWYHGDIKYDTNVAVILIYCGYFIAERYMYVLSFAKFRKVVNAPFRNLNACYKYVHLHF